MDYSKRVQNKMKNKNIVEEIRKFVEEECKKPTNFFGISAYENHIVFVVKYAKKLAEELNADLEVVELSAWLHDIASIMGDYENHHITGCKIAENKLLELNYPLEKIELIKKCILNHRGSVRKNKESIEEQIIADADAMSHFEDISGLFNLALVIRKLKIKEANNFVKNKLQRSWDKLSLEKSKKLIKPKYDAVMTLFENEY